MHRRTVFRWALSALAVLPFRRFKVIAAQASGLSEPHVATLRAVAAIVLPASLGPSAILKTSNDFVRWVREYKADMPTQHGYGNSRLQRTPPSPADAYVRQLEALEHAARVQGQPFARLTSAAQRGLVESALDEAKVKDLPDRPAGEHVITDLMGFYFGSSEANDLCYQADIGRWKCRGLDLTTKRPRPL